MSSNVQIGARWKPGHVVRRDSETGTFEEINSPLHTQAEAAIQQALLGTTTHSWFFLRYFGAVL